MQTSELKCVSLLYSCTKSQKELTPDPALSRLPLHLCLLCGCTYMHTQLHSWAANEEEEKGLGRVRLVWCGVDLFLLCGRQ